jgi:hypothetical protein
MGRNSGECGWGDYDFRAARYLPEPGNAISDQDQGGIAAGDGDMSEQLMEDIPRLLTKRQETHGDFSRTADCAQDFRDVFRKSPNWENMSRVQREVFDAWAVKMARVLCGDPDFPEHIIDIIGYGELYLRGKQP